MSLKDLVRLETVRIFETDVPPDAPVESVWIDPNCVTSIHPCGGKLTGIASAVTSREQSSLSWFGGYSQTWHVKGTPDEVRAQLMKEQPK